MGRSGQLSGATVALELLPKTLSLLDNPILATLKGEVGTATDRPPPLDRLSLVASDQSVPLGTLAGIAHFVPDPKTPTDHRPASTGDLREELGRLILDIIARGSADAEALYRATFCLARLNLHLDANRMVALLDTDRVKHPAILALKGYLALHSGEVDVGRRALARSALASRGAPDQRSILHFSQHVLLVHQFGG